MNKNEQGLGLRAQGSAETRQTGQASALSAQPSALKGSEFWRTLEERAGDPAFQERLYNEFPSEIEAITDPVARRTFLKLMGA